MKKSINNKKLFLTGPGLLIFSRLIFFVWDSMASATITVILDFIALPILAISFLRYLIGIFKK